MRAPAAIGLTAALIVVAGVIVGAALGQRRRTRVYVVPSRLPPEVLDQVLRRPGPYEHLH